MLTHPTTCRERVFIDMHPEHAAVRWSLTAGDCGDVRRLVLLPERFQRRLSDPIRRFPHVSGLHVPDRPHAQVYMYLVIMHRSIFYSSLISTRSISVHSSEPPDWSRPKRMNPKMLWRTWWTWWLLWAHMASANWNPPAWPLGHPSYYRALWSHSLLGKVRLKLSLSHCYRL